MAPPTKYNLDTHTQKYDNDPQSELINSHCRTTVHGRNDDGKWSIIKEETKDQRDTAVLLYSGNHYKAVIIKEMNDRPARRLRTAEPHRGVHRPNKAIKASDLV